MNSILLTLVLLSGVDGSITMPPGSEYLNSRYNPATGCTATPVALPWGGCVEIAACPGTPERITLCAPYARREALRRAARR